MCPDGTQWRQGSPDALDATRYGVWVQDAQDARSRREESGRNTTVSDAGHLFADVPIPPIFLLSMFILLPFRRLLNSQTCQNPVMMGSQPQKPCGILAKIADRVAAIVAPPILPLHPLSPASICLTAPFI